MIQQGHIQAQTLRFLKTCMSLDCKWTTVSVTQKDIITKLLNSHKIIALNRHLDVALHLLHTAHISVPVLWMLVLACTVCTYVCLFDCKLSDRTSGFFGWVSALIPPWAAGDAAPLCWSAMTWCSPQSLAWGTVNQSAAALHGANAASLLCVQPLSSSTVQTARARRLLEIYSLLMASLIKIILKVFIVKYWSPSDTQKPDMG